MLAAVEGMIELRGLASALGGGPEHLLGQELTKALNVDPSILFVAFPIREARPEALLNPVMAGGSGTNILGYILELFIALLFCSFNIAKTSDAICYSGFVI